MKKLCLLLGLVLLFACGPVPDQSESSQSLGTPDGYAVSCAASYTRVTPHHCRILSGGSVESTWSITSGTCNNHTLTTIPTNATLVDVIVTFNFTSTNTVNQKSEGLAVYHDNACGSSSYAITISAREFAIAGTDTQIYTFDEHLIAPVYSNVGVMTLTSNGAFTNTGASSSILFRVIGYYD